MFINKDHPLWLLSRVIPGFMSVNFCLGVGGSSKSSSTQNYDASTKVNTTNNQVGASEGSLAVGAGANLDASTGPKIQAGSGATIQTVDSSGLKYALENNSVSNQAISDIAKSVIQASQAGNVQSTGYAQAALDSAKSSALRAADSITSQSDKTQKKVLLIGGAALVLVIGIVILTKGKK